MNPGRAFGNRILDFVTRARVGALCVPPGSCRRSGCMTQAPMQLAPKQRCQPQCHQRQAARFGDGCDITYSVRLVQDRRRLQGCHLAPLLTLNRVSLRRQAWIRIARERECYSMEAILAARCSRMPPVMESSSRVPVSPSTKLPVIVLGGDLPSLKLTAKTCTFRVPELKVHRAGAGRCICGKRHTGCRKRTGCPGIGKREGSTSSSDAGLDFGTAKCCTWPQVPARWRTASML